MIQSNIIAAARSTHFRVVTKEGLAEGQPVPRQQSGHGWIWGRYCQPPFPGFSGVSYPPQVAGRLCDADKL